MFEMGHSEDAALVIELARNFATRELRPQQRAHEASGVGAAVARAAAATGLDELWTTVDPVTRCAALEELGFGDAGAALALVGPALAAAVARRLGIDARELAFAHVYDQSLPDAIAWLPTRGDRILCCDREGRFHVIVVRLEPIAALGLHAAGAARVILARTAEPAGALARREPGATPHIASSGVSGHGAHAVAELRLAVSALNVGVARAALEYACAYAQERVAFGKRLADHQAVAFALADVAIAIAAARVLVQRAALELEAVPALAAHAFVEAAGAALFATERGVQLLGGHGYLKDHPVEKWMRDARCLSLLAGGLDLALDDSERDAWERRWT